MTIATMSWDQFVEDAGVTEEELERARRHAARVTASMPLAEIRRAHSLTQQQLADETGMSQGGVSELEKRTDAHLSTLRRYIAATGGELRLVAHYPRGDIIIEQFSACTESERPVSP